MTSEDGSTYWLYRLWGASRTLLYIGISTDVDHRVKQHREKFWGHRIRNVEKEVVGSSLSDALSRERLAIRSESPRFNQNHNANAAPIDRSREYELRQRKVPPRDPKLASLQEASSYLGVCQRTVRRRISDGSLPGYRVGTRVIRVAWADLEALPRQIPTVQRRIP